MMQCSADQDENGRDVIVVGNLNSDEFSVLLGKDDGTFAPGLEFFPEGLLHGARGCRPGRRYRPCLPRPSARLRDSCQSDSAVAAGGFLARG